MESLFSAMFLLFFILVISVHTAEPAIGHKDNKITDQRGFGPKKKQKKT